MAVAGIHAVPVVGVGVFSSCDKDDDEAGGGGIMGYWLPLTDLRDMAREAVEEDNADEDGFTGGAVSYRFLNANTVESFTTNCYIGDKSAAFHTETVSGKTVSFVAENVRTYTYVLDGNKVYITDGTIGTLVNGELRVDGLLFTFQKLERVIPFVPGRVCKVCYFYSRRSRKIVFFKVEA